MAGTGLDVPVLEPYYYRDNFQRLLDTVESQYADMLSADECQFIDCWRAAGHYSQCLYVRLVSRVGPLFRVSRLNYLELQDLPIALGELLDCELMVQCPGLDTQSLGELYTAAEIFAAFGHLLPTLSSRRKSDLLAAIAELQLSPELLLERIMQQHPDMIVGPAFAQTVGILQLLFFGNRHQSLTDFVLSDLGLARYYPYALDRNTRLFVNRAALLEYLNGAALADGYYEAKEAADVDALLGLAQCMVDSDLTYPSSEYRWHRLCNRIARDLERFDHLDAAAALYAKSGEHPARERLARIYESQGNLVAALQLCEEIIDLPWCEDEEEAAQRIAPRVRRKLDGTRAVRKSYVFPQMHLQLRRESLAVEVAVANHLAPQWSEVAYVENRLMSTLFGLAFWEQIFAPIPGVFHNPFQSVPTDMFDRRFYANRTELIDQRLLTLETADLRVELSDAYSRYFKLRCRWVSWRISQELIEKTLDIVPSAHLLAIWRRILFDPRANRSGFPDLIALGARPGHYQLIEVKGPGDSLQNGQKRWLQYFQKMGVPASVAWVDWLEH